MKSKVNFSDKQRAGGRVAGPPVVVLQIGSYREVELRPGQEITIASDGIGVRLKSVYYPNKQAEGPPHKYRIEALVDSHHSIDGPKDRIERVIKAMDEANARRLFLDRYTTAEIEVVEQL